MLWHHLILLIALFFTPKQAFGQQNLFNIPSGEVTTEKDVFYQHQGNFYENSTAQSKQHIAYGLGEGYEIGFNILDVSTSHISEFERNARPLFAGTFQKGWALNDKFNLNLGTQIGTRYKARERSERLTIFNYGLLNYKFDGHSRLIGGLYQASNDSFLKGPDRFGVLIGYEWFLTTRFALMGDFISGRTESSVSVVGFLYSVTRHFQVCAGALIPNVNNPSSPGIVIEINLFSFDAY